jgi:hypothetical protein
MAESAARLADEVLTRGVRPACGAAHGGDAGRSRAGGGGRTTTAERPPPRHVAMTWAARLKRVFGIEIEPCARCGGRL